MWLNSKKSNNPNKEWAEELNRYFSKETYKQTDNKYIKRLPTLLIIR